MQVNHLFLLIILSLTFMLLKCAPRVPEDASLGGREGGRRATDIEIDLLHRNSPFPYLALPLLPMLCFAHLETSASRVLAASALPLEPIKLRRSLRINSCRWKSHY